METVSPDHPPHLVDAITGKGAVVLRYVHPDPPPPFQFCRHSCCPWANKRIKYNLCGRRTDYPLGELYRKGCRMRIVFVLRDRPDITRIHQTSKPYSFAEFGF